MPPATLAGAAVLAAVALPCLSSEDEDEADHGVPLSRRIRAAGLPAAAAS